MTIMRLSFFPVICIPSVSPGGVFPSEDLVKTSSVQAENEKDKKKDACGSVCGHSILSQCASTNQCSFISLIYKMQVPCFHFSHVSLQFSPYFFLMKLYNQLVKFLEICLGILIRILLNL